MWGILVGLIERWWRDKPRRDVVNTVVRLRDDMMYCHYWYMRFREALEAGDLGVLDPNPQQEWMRSVEWLTLTMNELDTVLSIFTPETHEALTGYVKEEGGLRDVFALQQIAPVLKLTLEIDIETGTMNDTFSQAMNELRKFICTNFKPEEVLAASRSNR